MPGQSINITMVDFQHTANDAQTCHSLGYINDVNKGHEVTICKRNQRIEHLYTSSGTKVEIHISTSSSSSTDNTFLLHYQGKLYNINR